VSRINDNAAHLTARLETCKLLETLLATELHKQTQSEMADNIRTLVGAIAQGRSAVGSSNSEFCLGVCRCLWQICENDASFSSDGRERTHKACLVREGAVQALLLISSIHNSNHPLLMLTWQLLGSLAERPGLPQPAMTRAISVAVSRAMQNHTDSRDVQAAGIKVLSHLCGHQTKDEAVWMLEIEYVKAIIVAVRTYSDDVFVQVVACEALSKYANRLTSFPHGKQRMHRLWDQGLGRVILSTMKASMANCNVLTSSTEEAEKVQRTFEECLGVLGAMIEDTECACDEGGLICILRLMEKYVTSPSLSLKAINVLDIMVRQSLQNRVFLAQNNVMRVVKNSMEAQLGNADLQTAGALTLVLMAHEIPDSIKYFHGEGKLHFLVEIMRVHMANVDVQKSVVTFMRVVTNKGGIRAKKALIKAGCVEAVVQAMHKHEQATAGHSFLPTAWSLLHEIITADLPQNLLSVAINKSFVEATIQTMRLCRDLHELQHDCTLGLIHVVLSAECNAASLGHQVFPELLAVLPYVEGDDATQVITSRALARIMTITASCKLNRPWKDDRQVVHVITAFARSLQFACTYKDKQYWEAAVFDMFLALYLIAKDERKYQDYCAEEPRLIPAIVQLLARHKQHHMIQLFGCQSLSAMSKSHPANTATIAKHGGLKRIFKAAQIQYDSSVVPAREAEAKLREIMLDLSSRAEGCSTLRDRHGWTDSTNHDADMQCVACGKSAAELGVKKLMRCSACTIAPCYCSAVCQRECWSAHKAECKANRK
jgi:hypothetical protein